MFIDTYETQTSNPNFSDYGWYVAEFERPLENRDRATIAIWCRDTFGPAGKPTGATETRWKDGIRYGVIYFRHQSDREWFLLRWS